LTPPLWGIPSEFLDKTYPAKTREKNLSCKNQRDEYDGNGMILTSTVFD